ncbi:patatin-like phospholipase family protein [Spirochaeta isovalerica]|uniref:NTE family protein n=1 Tax=Spirochaeta isovalerica TaxID=150 RepID=A0A841RCP4_9SPIO|nr:patatin-like phospholipase family protein [Spirochaeta isovalerica]MBB6481007.1 NTE family protein [Spirochaeta isovalerica]
MNWFGKKEEPWCLVLSGGGAKGIYHIGAWRALRELGVEVEAFIGNSIGAIIAGFLAQGNEEDLYFIGDNITVDFLIKIPEELTENGELKMNLKNIPSMREFYRDAIHGGGLDTTPLRKLLDSSIDEEKIRTGGKDLGVVTFNISELKAKEVFVEEMEPGTLVDYLMASSAFPGFHNPVIRGKKYIDGGVYDNIPYRLARARGYRKIITIDISGMGVNKRPNIEGTDTVYIKNSINMGGVLDFNREFLDRFRELGYLDTLKTFGALKGVVYFITPDSKAEKRFTDLLTDPQVVALLTPYLHESDEENHPVEMRVRSILPPSMRHNKGDLLYSLIECCAVIFRLEKIHQYSVNEMIEKIRIRQKEEDRKLSFLDSVKSRSESRQLIKRINKVLKETRVRENLKECPYYNLCLAEKILGGPRGTKGTIIIKGLHSIYPELEGALFFLELINKMLIIKI